MEGTAQTAPLTGLLTIPIIIWILAGTAIKYMPSDLTVLGDLTISSTFETNNNDLSIQGDWTNTGAFNEETGIVSFEGSTDQTITNAVGETFNDLTVNKSAGDLILANDVIVSSDLVMNSWECRSGCQYTYPWNRNGRYRNTNPQQRNGDW